MNLDSAQMAAWFTEEDVREQLRQLGYDDVPEDILAPFMRGAKHSW